MGKGKEAELEAVYRRIPEVHCKGLCQAFCGPLIMTRLERLRIVQIAGRGCSAHPETSSCNMLTPEGQCSVYRVRPTICRLWGAVRSLSCPHGCKPDRWLSLAEVIRIVEAVRRIGGPDVIGKDVARSFQRNPESVEVSKAMVTSQALQEGLISVRQDSGAGATGGGGG